MELRQNSNITKSVITKRQIDFEDENLINNKKSKSSENQNFSEVKLVSKNSNNEIFEQINENSNSESIKTIYKKSKNNNIHKNHRLRLKSQFLKNGYESLTDIQKLELLLFFAIPQKDTNPIAHELINEFGSVKGVFAADVNQLVKINGIKENTATLIKLVSSIFSSISKPDCENTITSVKDAIEFCRKLYIGVEVEQFYVICLAKSSRIMKVKLINSGSTDEINVQIRSITEFALETKCNRIIISHNHPAGIAKMSDEDFSFTFTLVCSCLLNSIEIIDHIIVGTDREFSFAREGVLQTIKESAVRALNVPKEKRMFLSSLSVDYNLSNEEDLDKYS